MLTAIETTATIGPDRQLLLDDDLPGRVSDKVRVIVLFPESDFNEEEWRRVISQNDVFDFLSEEDDIYTLDDGKPVTDEI